MAEDTLPSPRRRPVDALFGEDVDLKPKPTTQDTDAKQATPGYMVESPRPVNSLRPPPPEFPNDWHVNAPPEQVMVIEPPQEFIATPDPIMPPPKPANAEPPVIIEPIAEAVTFTTTVEPPRQTVMEAPSPFINQTPVYVAPPVAAVLAAAPAPMYGQAELVELSQFVDQLYQNVADETSDSAALNAECLMTLNAARVAIEKGDYAQAEAAAEQVKARLLRARASRTAAAMQSTKLLYAWLILAALAGLVFFAITFALRIVPGVAVLLRGTGLGMLGGAAMGLFQLSRAIAGREFDASFTPRYALSPLFGALIGAVIYLLSLLGILAAPGALGIPTDPFLLMYLFALLGGIFNDAIVNGLRGIVTRRKT